MYYMLPGSSSAPMVIGLDNRPLVVVESEPDAILLHQEAGAVPDVVTQGSAPSRPDKETRAMLDAAPVILLALDSDDAGAGEAWKW